LHDPIVYPAVVVKKSPKRDAARRFIDYVADDADARRLLESRGFARPKPASSSTAEATAPAGRRP
jgi:ABC-type molybdate transport system substrate-binding protein